MASPTRRAASSGWGSQAAHRRRARQRARRADLEPAAHPRPGRAAAFYASVFGWGVGDFGGRPVFQLGDRGVAGMMDMPPGTPDEVPAYWMTVFAVDDTDASAAKAAELGGRVVVPAGEIEGVGRFALLSDPQGVMFGIISAPPAA